MQRKAEAPRRRQPNTLQYVTSLKISLRALWEYRISLHLPLMVAAISETQLSLSCFRDQLLFEINHTSLASQPKMAY